MTKRAAGPVLLAAVIFAGQLIFSPLAHCQEKSSLDKLSLKAYAGSHFFPVKLITSAMDKTVIKSPDHFTGFVRGVCANWDFSEKWSLGLDFFKIESHGYGRWERNDTARILAENNVDLAVNGRTDSDVQGVMLKVERRFRVKSRVSPYVGIGGGIAQQTVTFNGLAAGHETQSGTDQPVVNDATDRVVLLTPAVSVEFGVQLKLRENLRLSPSLYSINGGYGAKLGLSLQL